jgi:flagellar protein FlaJ
VKFYIILQKILPRRFVNNLEKHLRFAGLTIDEEEYAGFIPVFSISAAVLTYILAKILGFDIFLSLLLSSIIFFGLAIFFYMVLLLLSSKRASFAEKVLPDLLLLTASNIRAGMPPDEAFLSSARPEFGPLSGEIKRAGKSILSGQSFENAFDRITEHINSGVLKRIVSLILDGIRSGGEISKLLEESANELRSMESLKKMISANVKSYIIFIFFAAGLGAPMLYGISTVLIDTVVNLGSSIVVPELPSTGYELLSLSGFSTQGIDTGFFVNFAYISMLITSFFGGLALGLIETGEQKSGLKYIPLLIALNFLVFLAVRAFTGNFIGGFS